MSKVPYGKDHSIASRLKFARVNAGMTQKELAEKTGIQQANISRIENGNGNPSVATLCKIAQGMGKKLIISFV